MPAIFSHKAQRLIALAVLTTLLLSACKDDNNTSATAPTKTDGKPPVMDCAPK